MDDDENSKYGFILGISLLANILQVADFSLNVTQTSNDALMKHLLEQDKILSNQDRILQEQTDMYLKKIIEQNEEIKKILKERQ